MDMLEALDPFEAALEAAVAELPEPYRAQLDSVAIVIEQEPTEAQLASVHARGLFGLYQGVPRTAYAAACGGRTEQDHPVPGTPDARQPLAGAAPGRRRRDAAPRGRPPPGHLRCPAPTERQALRRRAGTSREGSGQDPVARGPCRVVQPGSVVEQLRQPGTEPARRRPVGDAGQPVQDRAPAVSLRRAAPPRPAAERRGQRWAHR